LFRQQIARNKKGETMGKIRGYLLAAAMGAVVAAPITYMSTREHDVHSSLRELPPAQGFLDIGGESSPYSIEYGVNDTGRTATLVYSDGATRKTWGLSGATPALLSSYQGKGKHAMNAAVVAVAAGRMAKARVQQSIDRLVNFVQGE
jgi:hypothetical protein